MNFREIAFNKLGYAQMQDVDYASDVEEEFPQWYCTTGYCFGNGNCENYTNQIQCGHLCLKINILLSRS